MRSKAFAVLFAGILLGFMAASGGMAAPPAKPTAKYVFLFIGDGLGIAQRNSAELYVAATRGLSRPEQAKLVMNTFPAQGMNTTYDLTSVIPDSASAATAISCGFKTKSGVIGMDAQAKVRYETIAELAKKKGWKIGILSSVSLDHATPAAFYAHVPSRRQMYEISMQLVESGFDYFAGGQLLQPADQKDPGKPNALETAKKNGYRVAMGRAGFQQLKRGSGKVIAMNDLVDKNAAMYYALDQKNGNGHVTLAEYTAKGIELLENPKGFFMMIEGGKIDWACHANDAAASIHDVLALDEAVAEAVKFYQKHPQETLIIVTGDHETGGMTIGFAGTRYSSFVDKIRHQKMSYIEFGKKWEEYKKTQSKGDAKFEDILPLIKEAFGLYILSPEEKAALQKTMGEGKGKDASEEVKKAAKEAEIKMKYSMLLTDLELKVLQEAFQQSMVGKKERAADDYTYLLYGGYEPLAVKLTTILNNKAGIGWTSYSHTGVPVPTSALGVGATMFNGYYDQTDIYVKMMRIAGFGK
ncbi:MAG: alkaline phosphatase [Syntrophaceae bacterium]|nr:alkaline phosphatase [Syntrophaceae bacterium]